ncbi:MAG TPA: nucleoside-diphosphate sugar epimerase/dehydratase [Chitinophagaceae bacterium]|nr:nucleoside-diphosphate sugar epimerase/dehydratase [Chitinophagaceae bacterium]
MKIAYKKAIPILEFRKFLLQNRIAPKWLIFFFDLAICISSITFANLILRNFNILQTDITKLGNDIIIVGVISSVFFFIFKTYDGIIRFSEFHESIRSIFSIFFTFLVILLINLTTKLSGHTPIIANSALLVFFFIASFLIAGYRILVKSIYKASSADSDAVNVIIYGAELNGSLLQKMIYTISNSKYKVVAFVDDDEKLAGKTIDNIRIHSYRGLAAIIEEFHVEYLFFTRLNIDIQIKNKVVDECLERHVKVMNIPPVKTWIHGQLNLSQFQGVKIEELLGRPAIQLRNNAVTNFLREKRVLITGAAGSIGSELARQIAFMNPEALIVNDQTETGLHDLEYELQQKFNIGNRLKTYLADVKDENAMELLFQTYEPNIVFHAAAYKHVPVMENHPSGAVRNNVLGTKVVADLSVKYGVERFLFVSTDKAINPTNVMGASKRIAEMYCHSLHNKEFYHTKEDDGVYTLPVSRPKTKFITTRFGNVLASNGSVIPRFQEQINNGGPVTVTHPEIIRYFMTIAEACSLVLEAITIGNGGEVLLFDMGEPVKILDLAKKMIRLKGFEPGKDIEIIFTGLRPGEKLFEELLNKEEEVMPTPNKKIVIAKTIEQDYKKISAEINILLTIAADFNDTDVVRQMKRIVPEYISNNSVYELFDQSLSLNNTVSSSL